MEIHTRTDNRTLGKTKKIICRDTACISRGLLPPFQWRIHEFEVVEEAIFIKKKSRGRNTDEYVASTIYIYITFILEA